MSIRPYAELALKPAHKAQPAKPATPAKTAKPAKPAKPATAPKPEKKANPVKLREFRVDYTYLDKNGTKKIGSVKKMAGDAKGAKVSVQLDLNRGNQKNAKVSKVH